MEEVGEHGNLDADHASGNIGMKAVEMSSLPRSRAARLGGQQGFTAAWSVRAFLLAQIVIVLSMVSIHFGLLLGGYRHRSAGTAELLIALVLVAGLLLTWRRRPWNRWAPIAAQSFGILGVMAGLWTIAAGIGPRSILDLTLNAALLLTLTAGLAITLHDR